jgi:hypothetical protein
MLGDVDCSIVVVDCRAVGFIWVDTRAVAKIS